MWTDRYDQSSSAWNDAASSFGVVAGEEPLRLLEQRLRAVGLGVLAGLHEVEVGLRDEQVRGVRRRRGRRRPSCGSRARTAAGAGAWSSGSCARCRGASTRGARRRPSRARSMICSPSSIALARTTSSSAVSSATLPISLRYIRTGSSIPIMSADERLELLGRSAPRPRPATAWPARPCRAARRWCRPPRPPPRRRPRRDSSAAARLGVLVGARGRCPPRRDRRRRPPRVGDRRGGRAIGATRAHRGELRLLELAPGPAGPRREHRFDELLVEGIGHVRGTSGLMVRSDGEGAGARVSPRGHRRAGEEAGLVAAPVERPALLVEETALERAGGRSIRRSPSRSASAMASRL